MDDRLLLSIDQGTTSSRAIVFNAAGEVVSVSQKELELIYPNKGWVEQRADDIWRDTLGCIRAALDDLGGAADDIAAAGITNQRETTILWDRNSGEAVYNAIVWQDRRTADFCQSLKDAGREDMVAEKTGLLLDPYFSATKIAWILDHVDGVRARAERGEILFGTVDCYLLWKLTSGRSHYTDITNASRSMLYNIATQSWDDDLLVLFNIPRSILPEVKDNIEDFGQCDAQHFGRSISVGGMVGDQQSALIGQACFEHGMVKSTYGTGCFALMNIGPDFKQSENRLLTTVAYRIGGEICYALEGSIFVAGAAVQWLRDALGLFDDAAESEVMAASVEDSNQVYFVPAFTGLGAPHWNPDARAMISGLSRDSKAAHIVRAALEAQGYQTRDLMDAMRSDSGAGIDVMRIDGGLAANRFVCQFIADMLNIRVEVPDVAEATAWGAACLAGVHAQVFNDLDDAAALWRASRIYEPSMLEAERATLYAGWRDSVSLLMQ